MLICDAYKFVFIHVHRTGGTSITEMCERLLPDTRQVLWQHTHIGSASFDIDSIRGYTTFAFVRNPWERLYSWYSLFTKYNPRKDQETFSFEEFLYNYTKIARNYGIDKNFRFNQLDYFQAPNGKIIPSFVGRYETFTEDVLHMFDSIGIRVDSISWLNAAEHPCYRREYSTEAREFVADLCAKDIDYWNYQF
jgi:hypothetical protein